MRKATLPHASGVYQIRCLPTGKIYVGSAIDFQKRWTHHRLALKRGRHRNRYLQSAWDKYGDGNFVMEVLEFALPADLLRVEQKWIDLTQCTDKHIGFNLYPVAGSPGDTFAQVWNGFIDPDGNEIIIYNLQDFCRQHDLDFPSMHRLAKGNSKLKSHKGWQHKNSVRQRDYVKTYEGFIDPNGNTVEPITNLAAFCRERGLDNTHMVALVKGKLCSHQGWTHKDGRQQIGPKVYTGFVSPKGQRVTITNLKAFCERYQLCQVHMHELKSGKRKSHKGWTWREDDE